MEITAEKPGKKLGYILHALLEEVLDDVSKNTQEYLDTRTKELMLLDSVALEELGEAGKLKQADEESSALKAIAREHKVG